MAATLALEVLGREIGALSPAWPLRSRLQRAFQVAGARTVLMSLWDVDDHTAREWMRHLYDSRLRGRTTIEATRDASLAILAARRAAGVTTHPSSWGAFVAAGDWR